MTHVLEDELARAEDGLARNFRLHGGGAQVAQLGGDEATQGPLHRVAWIAQSNGEEILTEGSLEMWPISQTIPCYPSLPQEWHSLSRRSNADEQI